MLPIAEFEARFRDILAALDDIADGEDMEELNAEFEDALFMLSQIDPRADDAPEEFMDAMDEFDALRADYARIPSAREVAERLGMLIGMARGNEELGIRS